MRKLHIFFISILLTVAFSATYENLQKEYKAMRIETISTLVPHITLETDPPKKVLVSLQKFFNVSDTDPQNQLREYEENFNKFTQTYKEWKGKAWKSDPELSAVFDLNEGKKNESFIVKGTYLFEKGWENSILVMDINVNNIDPLNNKHDGVMVFVTNLSGLNGDIQELAKADIVNKFQETLVNNIQFKTVVKKHAFISIPFSSDIYEVWVVRQPLDGEQFSGVHVSFQMAIEQQPVQSQSSQRQAILTPEQEEEMVLTMKQIVQQNNLTFLDSLEIWEKVDQHRRQHEKSYEWNDAIEWYECLGIFLMYVIEYVIIRFIAKKKQVI